MTVVDAGSSVGAVATSGASTPARWRQGWATVGAYVALTKPRIIELLLVTTVPTMFLAAGGVPSLTLVLATFVGGSLAAGSANSLNCFVDRDIDEVMTRTGNRPLATHRVSPRAALDLRAGPRCLGARGDVAGQHCWRRVLTLFAIVFYVVVYTLGLKRRTASNIVWGGIAGCMPVLIGWAAVTGSLAWPAWILFWCRVLVDAPALLGAGPEVPR